MAILERHDDTEWREVARFASVREADHALDAAIANEEAPDSLRVVERYPASNRLLMVAGTIAVALAIAIVVYIIFG